MRLKKLTISQLEQFVNSDEHLSYGDLPITLQRAFSQVKNPKALPEDVVLTLALSDSDELIGFIGALPDNVGPVRCAWNSCWWVKEGTPAEVSLKLFFSFLSDWDKKVLFSELTPHTSLLIEKLKFCNHKTVQGIRGYYRFCVADILPRKRPIFRKVQQPLLLFDAIANWSINLFSPNTLPITYLTVEEVDFPDENLNQFISKYNCDQPAKRSSADFKWIKENSWLIQKPHHKSELSKRYSFSYEVNRFELHWVKFFFNSELVGLVCYTIRDKELKLPYVFVDENHIGGVGSYFYGILKSDRSLCSITTFHRKLSDYLSTTSVFWFKTRLPKFTAISKVLYNAAELNNFELQMGDGDCIFT